MDTLLTLDSNGAHLETDELKAKLANKSISASMVTALTQCHARWVANTFVVDTIVEPPLDTAATRGTLFHAVMENYFALPQSERTHENMKKTVGTVLAHPDFAHFATNRDAVLWLRGAVNNYYRMGARPDKVTVATVPTDRGDKPGLETFVKGQIGNASRQTLGFIDQVLVDHTNPERVIVSDWKSGAKAKPWDGKTTSSSTGWAEQRQQLLYSMLLEQRDVDVSHARLVYPIAQSIVKVDTHNEHTKDVVRQQVEHTDHVLDTFVETNTFEYSPSALCSWCPLVNMCPQAEKRTGQKFIDAVATQPSAQDLSAGICVDDTM